MIPEREREALMRLTMCAREECIMCKYHKKCDFDFKYEIATESMNILADALNADRKTEPNCSEKPNNCENEDIFEYCPRCGMRMLSKWYEPQRDCLTCRYNSDEWDSPKCDGCSKAHSNYEPQTDCAWMKGE